MEINRKKGDKIAAITMARNDLFFLERWINYYGKQLGKENLYIYLDGLEQELPRNIENVNFEKLVHKEYSRAKGDKYRIGLLNKLSHQLFESGYTTVIGTDADEFLIVDPLENKSLKEFILQYSNFSTISALGLDLGNNINKETPLSLKNTFINLGESSEESLLFQRSFALLSSRYTKTSVLNQDLNWGSGFHRVKGKNYHIIPQLYLIHTGYCDCQKVLNRSKDQNKIQEGWESHLKRRAKTIYYTSNKTAINGDNMFKIARIIQTIFRPIFALNKPYMPFKRVILIPSRFKNIFI